MRENEWTPGTLYWYEDELKSKDAEIARLRAEALQCEQNWAADWEREVEKLEAEIERLRAALQGMLKLWGGPNFAYLEDSQIEEIVGNAREALALAKEEK